MKEKFLNCISKNKEKISICLFMMLVAFVTLAITSNNSFLHATNAWRDANAFFTVGKAMANGQVVYKDIFEQKGPLLYGIYMIGSYIISSEYWGVFLLEVLFCTVGLVYTYKTVRLYVDNDKRCKIITTLFWIFIVCAKAFVYGGSAEEFCFPFFAISIYYFFAHLKGNIITRQKFLGLGLIAGCVLLIKYNLLAFWFAFMAIIFFEHIFKREYKSAFVNCICFLVGMLIPFALTNIYMFANDALSEFYEKYFFVNAVSYASSRYNQFNYVTRLFLIILRAILTTPGIVFTAMFLFLPAIFWFWKKHTKEKIYFIILMLFTTLGIYLTINIWDYYILPLMFIMIIPFTICCDMLFESRVGNAIEKLLMQKNIFVQSIICMFSICFIILGTTHTEYFLTSKKDIPLTRFAEIINREENPTLVNMGGLDVGLYQFANVLPSTYYFEMQYIEYERFPYIIDTFKEYIKNKETMFIVFYSKDTIEDIEKVYGKITDNYDLVDKDFYEARNIYLFKVK